MAGDGGYLQVIPVLTDDGRALQMTPVNSKEGLAFPELTISRKAAGPSSQPIVLQLITIDGCLARPSIPTPPGTDGTIARQGPAVQKGQLGTLKQSDQSSLGGRTRAACPG